MNQQDALLSALLKSEQRRPVDVNLGQVPITPTIGRMGNYTVVTRETPRDNPALELSRALSQLPQLLGQAKNISVASGLKQAEEMDLEEIEKRFSDGDTEAEGFMTWLGGNKAFHEAAYQRIFNADIKPRLQKVSSEIDGMTYAEMMTKFDSDESIKEYAQSRLVGELDPGIMETIEDNSWLAIRHNKAMEAIIPDYVQKAAASIDARKRDFQEKEALAAVETNFFAHADFDIALPGFDIPDSAIDQMDSALAASQSAQYIDPNKLWKDNLQASIDFAVENGFAGRLDKFQIEAKLIPALTAKYRMLIEDDKFSEADLFLELMESGSLNINGRPINKSSAGMNLIETAESLLERSLEDDEGEFDQKKVDSYMLKEITRYNDARALSDFQTEDYEDYYRKQRADLDNPELGLSVREQLELSKFYDKEIARLRGSERIYENFSNPAKDKKKEEFKQTYETTQRTILKKGISVERARESSGLDPAEFNSMFLKEVKNQYEDVTGMVFRPETEHILFDAALQAEMSTMETYIDRPRGDLFLGSDSVNAGNVPNQTEFRQEVSETAQGFLDEALGKYFSSYAERMKAQNPPVTPEETQQREMDSAAVKQKRRVYRRMAASGETLTDENGNIRREKIPSDRQGEFSLVPDNQVDFYYPLTSANNTFNNEIGRIEFKSAPVSARLYALKGLAKEAGDLDRVIGVAEDIESVVGQDQEGALYDKELDLVRHSGLPLNTLLKDKGEREVSIDGGFFSEDTTAAILYNKYGHFNDPKETTKRVFNLPAVIRYIQTGEDKRLSAIHDQYLKDKMPLKDFINNQVTFFESFAGSLTDVQTPQQTNK